MVLQSSATAPEQFSTAEQEAAACRTALPDPAALVPQVPAGRVR